MARSFNRIVLAALIAGSATSAFAGTVSVDHSQALRGYQATSQVTVASSQTRPVETQAERALYDHTRQLSGY
jgi:hypothetical protein